MSGETVSLPGFLVTGTAALLAEAPSPTPEPGAVTDGTVAARLYQELVRRLEAGETRLWSDDLVSFGFDLAALQQAFPELRRLRRLAWEAGTPYLYVSRSTGAPASAPVEPDLGLTEAVRALEEATGKVVNPLVLPRLKDWLTALGKQEFLDVVGLCRGRGPCEYRHLAYELDKEVNRRRRMSEFGPVMGLGVVQTGGVGRSPGLPLGPEPLANAAAYEPVAPGRVKYWVEANPDLYSASELSVAVAANRPAAQASAYERVSADQVKRWVEAFPDVYEPFYQEYDRLIERAQGGPFRRKSPRVR